MIEFLPPFQPLHYFPLAPGDGKLGRGIAWVVIVLSGVSIAGSNWLESRQAAKAGTFASGWVELPLQLMGRYAVGTHGLTAQSGSGDPATQMMVAELDAMAKLPVDKLGAVAVVGELLGKQAALDRLAALRPSLPPELCGDAEVLRTIYDRGPQALSAVQIVQLHHRLGWLAELAESYGKRDDDPQRAAVLSASRRTVAVMFAGGGLAFFAAAVGFVLLIVLLIRLADHKLIRNYQRPGDGAGAFLEAFAIYIAGMAGASFVVQHVPGVLGKSLTFHIALMLVPITAVVWPLIRGVGSRRWRDGLGWHVGRGPFREIGFGVLGYLAGLPILIFGFIITFVLIKTSNAHPSHPIEHMLGGSKSLTFLVFVLASIYAPITEETMFRGAFFHAMRARHRWWLSALVTAFTFAAIHPQGWTTIPTLMAIAIVFAGIREWRGTILSSAAAHCVHNTAVLVFMITLLS